MKKSKSRLTAAPFYTVAVVFLIYSSMWPIYNIGRLIAAVVLAFVGFMIVKALCGSKTAPAEEEKAEEKPKTKAKAEEEKKYSPEVQAIIDEGKRAQSELGRLYASIPDMEVKHKIRDIMEVSDKIIEDAIDDPSDVPQIKKFLDYYLPTTIKLLNAYDRMGAQGIEGENITGTMKSISEMLDTAIEAYHKLLDSLFANQALDVETDIEVMNTLLKREGLSGGAGAI